MPRSLTELEIHLQQANTLDVPARQATLIAVNDMMEAATRSGELLRAAREASVRAAGNSNSPAQQNAASLAREAYTQRTNAEVAKYRAAYAIMAEQNGEESASAAEAAKNATTAKAQGPFISKANYHGKVRDLMMQASAACAQALKSVPPLPFHVAPAPRIGPEDNVARGGSAELMAQPTYGWRPKKYSELMGDFYPTNYKLAAGALSGVHGVSVGSQFGTADATTNMPTGESWWVSLQKALGYGVKTAGEAAAVEGQKVAERNPAGGSALQVGGNVLNALSAMLGVGVGDGMSGKASAGSASTGPSIGSVILIGGGVAVGGFLLWKFLK